MSMVDGVMGAAAGWAAAVVGGYLALGFLAAVAGRCRPAAARRAEHLLLLYPRFLRSGLRTLAVAALGVGVASPSTTALASQSAHGGRPRPPVVAPARPGVEPLDWPVAATSPPRTAVRHARAQRAQARITVRSGDCLWSLAAREIGPEATRAQVAAAWPRWWSANRGVIGADPDVLLPGLQLSVPTAIERNAS